MVSRWLHSSKHHILTEGRNECQTLCCLSLKQGSKSLMEPSCQLHYPYPLYIPLCLFGPEWVILGLPDLANKHTFSCEFKLWHIYTKILCIVRNSNITGHPVFYLALSTHPTINQSLTKGNRIIMLSLASSPPQPTPTPPLRPQWPIPISFSQPEYFSLSDQIWVTCLSLSQSLG